MVSSFEMTHNKNLLETWRNLEKLPTDRSRDLSAVYFDATTLITNYKKA